MSSGAGTAAHLVRAEIIMGLPVSIHVRDVTPGSPLQDAAQDAITGAFREMRRFDRIFSPYRDDSTLTAVRAGLVAISDAGDEFAEMLERADEAKRLTDGAFDVCFAGELDPSGLVKGWAAERAGESLDRLDRDWYLNAGGDISCRARIKTWRIGIEHPTDPSGLITVVGLVDGGLATSGSAHRGAHIFDPATRTPASGVRQVTVVGPSLARADMWATAIAARGHTVLHRADDPLIPACLADGHQVFAVADTGTVYATKGFAALQVDDLPRPEAVPFASMA